MISHFEGQQHVLSIPNLSEGFFGNLKNILQGGFFESKAGPRNFLISKRVLIHLFLYVPTQFVL